LKQLEFGWIKLMYLKKFIIIEILIFFFVMHFDLNIYITCIV